MLSPSELEQRRRFLKAAAAAGAGALIGPGVGLASARTAASQGGIPDDYRALVCVFLSGGNDSHNTLVPRSGQAHQDYLAARQNLALSAGDLLPIDPLTPDGREYGLHPQLGGCQALFQEGKLALVRNVGTLVEPVTKSELSSGAVPVPPQLFSHKDQIEYWQTASEMQGTQVGWAGRIADRVAPFNGSQPLLTSISLSGTNRLQTGAEIAQYVMAADGPSALNGFIDTLGPLRRAAFDEVLGADQPDAFARTYARIQREAIELEGFISTELDQLSPLATVFPPTPLGQQLRMIAEMIAVRGGLGVKRQVFFAEKGNFDSHSNLVEGYGELMADLDASLLAFQRAMEELGAADEVVLFTASEFGRTLSSNGKGSDHGWGGHSLVLGGPVAGGDLYGTMPELIVDGPDDAGLGRLIPTTALDEYGATLAKWHGVPPGELAAVFPNLGNFATPDLGFLG